jgi:hypothetical protein
MSFQSQESPRRQLDALKSVTMVLPIISNTSNTNIIDLECVNTFPALEQVSFIAATQSANANSGNAAALTFIMQHSADTNTANFANVPWLGATSIASNGAVYPATNTTIPVTAGLLRYVRLQVAQAAGGANSANAANITFALAF